MQLKAVHIMHPTYATNKQHNTTHVLKRANAISVVENNQLEFDFFLLQTFPGNTRYLQTQTHLSPLG